MEAIETDYLNIPHTNYILGKAANSYFLFSARADSKLHKAEDEVD